MGRRVRALDFRTPGGWLAPCTEEASMRHLLCALVWLTAARARGESPDAAPQPRFTPTAAFHGNIQVNARHFLGEPGTNDAVDDSFYLRRVRPWFEGRL